MKIKTSITIVAMSLMLVGCKTSIETEVSLTDLLQGPTKVIPSSIQIEVAACNDYQDSRKPSSSLVDVQKSIPDIFKDAEYVECFRQKMDSFAKFTVPVYLDKDRDGKLASEDHLVLLSSNNTLLAVSVPEQVRVRFDNANKKMMGVSLDMSVAIKVTNDTGGDFRLSALSTFIDGQPVIYQNLTVPKDAKFTLRLSDVSVQAALAGSDARVLLNLAGS